MKTLKKLFSVSAIVALLGTLAPMYAFGATYSDELEEAYKYAYAHEVTTMTSIDNADMYGSLTRIALAKMIANYAINVLGMTPDTSAKCTFTDVTAALDTQYDNGVTKACQLGLMGQNITAFRPNDLVTRAEFGTTLSRALNANSDELASMNAANPYYKDHLNFLKSEGIMNQIDNPGMTEVRGYVMLMMMRADENYTPVEGCTAEELLACITADDYDACIAACSGDEEDNNSNTVVKAGTLNVSAKSNDGAKIFIDGVSELDTIKLNASEEISVEKVTLERYGYINNAGITVWLENEDGIQISNKKDMTASKDEVTLTVKKDYRNAKENKSYVVVVNVGTTGHQVGDTLGFKVTDVISSAETLKIASYSPATYSLVTYTSSNVTAELKGKDTTYNYEAGDAYQVAKFRVKAGNAEIAVKGFTLTETGSSNLDLAKYIDGVEVKAGETSLKLSTSDVNKDGTIKVAFPEQTIEAKKYVDFTVFVSLKDDFEDFGKKIILTIDSFNATEVKTSARVTPTISGTEPVYTFQGTKIKVTNTNLGKVSTPWGSEDVVVAEGTLELSEPIELNDFVIESTSTGVESLELWLNGSLVAEGDLNSAKTGFTFKDALLDKSGKLQFVADFVESDDAPADTSITLKPTFNKTLLANDGIIGKYDDSNEDVLADNFAGSISFSSITIETAKGNLENNITRKVEVLADGTATRVTLFEGTYTAKKGDVYLNSGTIKEDSSIALGEDETITFYVTIGNTEYDVTLESGEIADSETFSNVLVRKGGSVNVKVEAEVVAYNTGNLVYNLALAGEDTDGNDIDASDADMTTLNRVSAGSVTVVATNANDVVLRGNNVSLAKFTVKPKLDNTRLTSFELSLTGEAANLIQSDLKITVDGNVLENSDYTIESGTLKTVDNAIDEAMDNDGIDIEVVFKSPDEDGDDDGEYALTLAKVNGNTVSKKFNTYIVPAIVKITEQEDKGDYTLYTFSVDKYDESYDVDGFTMNSTVIGSITDGQQEEIANGTSMVFITGVVYTVDTNTITISKDSYKDYFRLGDSFLKIFKAKD